MRPAKPYSYPAMTLVSATENSMSAHMCGFQHMHIKNAGLYKFPDTRKSVTCIHMSRNTLHMLEYTAGHGQVPITWADPAGHICTCMEYFKMITQRRGSRRTILPVELPQCRGSKLNKALQAENAI